MCIVYSLVCINQEGWLSPTERASVSAHFGLPLGTPLGTIAVNLHGWKDDSMLHVKRIAACTHLSSTVIYEL